MATLLMGYDVEFLAIGENLARAGLQEAIDYPGLPQDTTDQALEIIRRNHEEFDAPATLFTCGRTVVHSLPALARAREVELFDLQQHTYSHVLFKDDTWEGGVFRASPPQALALEVAASSQALEDHLGVDCTGIRTPHGYHLGLSDRPELVGLLHDAGIRFVSSWGRNAEGGNPTPLDVQPFWYADQGYPDVLELPFQFWLDGVWFEVNGIDRGAEFLELLKTAVDEIVEHDLVYGVCFHDWAMLRYNEPGTGWVRGLLAYARERDVEILSYRDYYEREAAA